MGEITFFDGLMEQVEFEHKLFESVLQVNFRKTQILKEADETATNNTKDAPAQTNPNSESDDKKQKFFTAVRTKLAEAWSNVVNWFKNTINTVAEKIKNIILSDKKIIDKYSQVLTTNAAVLKNFDLLKDFKAANVVDYNLPVKEVESLVKDNNFLFSKDCKDNCAIIDQRCDSAFVDVSDWSAYNWGNAFDILNSDRLANDILVAAKALASSEGSIKQKILDKGFDLETAVRDKINDKTSGDANQAYNRDMAGDPFKTLAGENLHVIQATMKKFISTYVAYFKAIRRACIACGTYALKNQGGTEEAQQEATNLAFLADVQCEQYLDESFSFT